MSDKALAIVPRSMPEVQSLAEVLAKSTLMPDALRNKAPDVVVQILAGQELGLSPMASIRGVHIVQGKPILSADTMVGLVLASGVCEYFAQIEASATSVTFETKRKGSPVPQRCTWTMEDAKRAAVNGKDNWKTFPRQMLSARARAELARSVYPDVLAGVYVPEEQVDVRVLAPHTPVNDAVDAEFTDIDPLSAIDTAESVDALKALAPSLGKLSTERKKEARTRYDARMSALTQPQEATA
jgi:hypothetical protein